MKWAGLTFLMGPLMKGHFDGHRESQENDDGSEDAPWLQYDQETARILFLAKEPEGEPFLSIAFGQKGSIKKIFVGRALIGGQTVAATTISLRDIVLGDGFPVYWKPDIEALRTGAVLLGGEGLDRMALRSPIGISPKIQSFMRFPSRLTH